jgi:hypothetical protein
MRIPSQNVGLPASTLALLQSRTASGSAGGAASDAAASGVTASRRIAASPAVAAVASGQSQNDRPASSSPRLNAHAVERPMPPSSDRPPPRGSLLDILA